MKKSKAVLSLLLAVILLIGALPLTAYAVDADADAAAAEESADSAAEALADTGASADIAEAGEDTIVDVNVNNLADIMNYMTISDTTKIYRLTLQKTITSFIGYEQYTDERNYYPIWCTVGKGVKYLNLNGYGLNFQNNYMAGKTYRSYGHDYIERVNTLCLFRVPTGATLIVADNASNGNGRISYSGKVERTQDGIDNRDIFHVDGGTLIVNSGTYEIPDKRAEYDYGGIIQINGTAVTVNGGEAILNGGHFYGRGNCKYGAKDDRYNLVSETRNAAVKMIGKDARVTINGGCYYGMMHAYSFKGEYFNANNLVVKAGYFSVESYGVSDDSRWRYVWTDYMNDINNTEYGTIGLPLHNADPYTTYYTLNSSGKVKTQYNSSNITSIYGLREPVYIAPNTEKPNISSLATTNTKQAKLLRNGSAYVDNSLNPADTWNKNLNLYVYIDPDSLAFPDIYPYVRYRKVFDGIQTRMTGTVSIKDLTTGSYLKKDANLVLGVDYQYHFMFNLKNLDATAVNAMQEGRRYRLEIMLDEIHTETATTYHCTHNAYYTFKYQEMATIRFDANGGKGNMMPVKVSTGSNYTVPACSFDPPNSSNMFVGWLIKGESSTSLIPPGAVIVAMDRTLVAQWNGTCLASFVMKNVDGTSSLTVHDPIRAYNNNVQLPTSEYSKGISDGYSFEGWRTSYDSYKNLYKAGTNFQLTSNTTFEAAYNCRITFEPNGGNGSAYNYWEPRLTSYTLPDGGLFRAPEGKEFNGWQLTSGGTMYKAGASYYIYNPVTFKATWKTKETVKQVHSVGLTITEPKAGEKPNFTVTKNSSDVDIRTDHGNQVIQNHTGLEFIDHSKGEPTGNKFIDWKYYMNPDETFKAGQKYTARVFLTTENKTNTVFAKDFAALINDRIATTKGDVSSGTATSTFVDYTFTVSGSTPVPKTCKVTFDANGGSGTMAAVTVKFGMPYTLPACTFTAPAGKEFDKWNLGAVGEKITVLYDTVLKAQWKDKSSDGKKKILLGDLNGNGKVNNADYQLLARYTLGWPGAKEKIKVFEAADLNQNGKVNNADYQLLARYVLGWKGYDKYIKEIYV